MSGPRLHPRTLLVNRAGNELERELLRIAKRDSLTYVETVGILAQILAGWTKYALREERHPDQPDRAADIE